ncbi:putative circadian clock protein, KaiC [Desulfonatronospira thiodismutans ASO3-1]|uniref:non-specific serine/threonine protein kinase n=1 Tax=Desulfonatronospira thiodismutans ASO3-1 TaxID=555779 RepID=D6SSH3_9BACT|nr:MULTISPECIES: circadian clock protein KaiC [Desulfonatronospira]EFI33639.1 putative circadian clock protein, KaiC [Desulfonatronospira thiodismutans ASO3-1]RQD74011.1 MAG: circadian clock protein KaiC [Desulfonatronospira sp. MSAO_Bac3]
MTQHNNYLSKSPTGIQGLDEVLDGGLPSGRSTLVCGSAGCGKTLLGMEFLIHGAQQFQEPGVFVAFEETEEDLARNVASLGYDLTSLVQERKMLVEYVHVAREEIQETGEFSLEGLFIRLEHAINTTGARRVVLDTLETLFSALPNHFILRAELRRLVRWFKDRGVTVILTGEQGEGTMTRHGLEEYVSDCVIMLDHRVINEVCTRRLRVVKYRGSTHGTNEYPFLIDGKGFSVLPVTSLNLQHRVSTERVNTGITGLDNMLDNQGYYRGSTVLISGTAGTGKSSIAAHFADAAGRRGEKTLYFTYEESPHQVLRNMSSIGIHLEPWINQDVLRFEAARPSVYGIEMHLARIMQCVKEFQPSVVIVDPINSLLGESNQPSVKAMLMRLADFLKGQGITALFTSLTIGGRHQESTDTEISSLIDTWLLLRDIEISAERNRGIYILKSRGMNHSKQIREFILTDHGVELVDVYAGTEGILTGTARLAREARDRAEKNKRSRRIQQKKHDIENRRKALEAKISAMQAEFESQEAEINMLIQEEQNQEQLMEQDMDEITKSRQGRL